MNNYSHYKAMQTYGHDWTLLHYWAGVKALKSICILIPSVFLPDNIKSWNIVPLKICCTITLINIMISV